MNYESSYFQKIEFWLESTQICFTNKLTGKPIKRLRKAWQYTENSFKPFGALYYIGSKSLWVDNQKTERQIENPVCLRYLWVRAVKK